MGECSIWDAHAPRVSTQQQYEHEQQAYVNDNLVLFVCLIIAKSCPKGELLLIFDC
jgi:hypothetical protein